VITEDNTLCCFQYYLS